MQLSRSARLCLKLSSIQGFGLKLFHQLASHYGSIETWHRLTIKDLLAQGLKPNLAEDIKTQLASDEMEDSAIQDWLSEGGAQRGLICYFDSLYPSLLREITLAPVLLYLEGDASLLSGRSIAIVGSRKPSLVNQRLAEEFAYGIAKQDLVVTSGLAQGIDTSAHMGALAANGKTIAVLGTGIDRCYPKQNQDLYARISEQGLLMSEMPLGSAPLRQNFPRRNRIVSGLSDAVIVVEAGIKSGSLITARYAIEQNRDVFAVPGGAKSVASEGCHYLIREGARLVSNCDDLLNDMALSLLPNDSTSASSEHSSLSPQEQSIYQVLGESVLSFDDLLLVCDMALPSLSNLLLEMELKGLISAVAGGYQKSS